MSNQPPKTPKTDPAGRLMSASIGATAAVAFSVARGQSFMNCLMVVCVAVVFTLVLDELGWV
ncbi:MAG: hypothetical protein AB4040_15280 [Synechococcus sp.]